MANNKIRLEQLDEAQLREYYLLRDEAATMIQNIKITTANIEDGSITEAKLSLDLQRILGNLDEIYLTLKRIIGGTQRENVSEYLVDLENLRKNLAININSKGGAVEGITDGVSVNVNTSTLTQLVDKVKDIFSIAEFNGIICYFERDNGQVIDELPSGTLKFVRTQV